MRKMLFCLGLLMLVALPLAAQPLESPACRASAVDRTDPAADPGALFESLTPPPSPRACEHNFCSIARNACQSMCAPCGINFSCKNVQCESTCTCAC